MTARDAFAPRFADPVLAALADAELRWVELPFVPEVAERLRALNDVPVPPAPPRQPRCTPAPARVRTSEELAAANAADEQRIAQRAARRVTRRASRPEDDRYDG